MAHAHANAHSIAKRSALSSSRPSAFHEALDLPRVRVLVVGDSGAGKTQFCRSLARRHPAMEHDKDKDKDTDKLSTEVSPTIGCDVHISVHSQPSGVAYFTEWLDVGGHRKWAISRDIYYRQLDAILIMYDAANRRSYDNIRYWISEIRSNEERLGVSLSSLPVLCVGSKADIATQNTIYEPIKDFGVEGIMSSAFHLPGDSSLSRLDCWLDALAGGPSANANNKQIENKRTRNPSPFNQYNSTNADRHAVDEYASASVDHSAWDTPIIRLDSL